MKATKEDACKLVSKCYDLVIKGKKISYCKGNLEAYEMIAKGHSIIDVLNRQELNENQKKELIKIIKKL